MREVLKHLFFDAEDFLAEGQFAKAIKVYEKALSVALKDDEEEIFAINFLGMAHTDAGNDARALEYFKKLQKLVARLIGKDSIIYAVALGNEGMIYYGQKKYSQAEQLMDQAIEIFQRIDATDNLSDESTVINVLEVYGNIGDCKAQLGKFAESVKHLRAAFEIAKKHLDPAHPRFMQAAIEYQSILHASGKKKDAKAVVEELADIVYDAGMGPQQLATAMAPMFFQLANNFEKESLSALSDLVDNGSKSRRPLNAKSAGKSQVAAKSGQPYKSTKASKVVGSSKSAKSVRSASNVVPLFAHQPQQDKCWGYQLKITLKRVQPPVWRRVSVPADYNLAQLHQLIQRAMGWSNSHLHEFVIDDQTFGDPKFSDNAMDEEHFELVELDLVKGFKFDYIYDFGDGWEHSILVEKELDKDELEQTEVFIKAQGGCPPEDCGGPYGFKQLVELLNDPNTRRGSLPDHFCYYDPSAVPDMFPAAKVAAVKKAKAVDKATLK